MRFAVVTAVYNEEKHIGRLLEALAAQTRPPDEIVVADDGSTDGTAAVVESFARRFPVVRLVRQPNRGPAAARNLAWRGSSAEVCVFTDGDCVPDERWLETYVRAFEKEGVQAAAGSYRTLNVQSALARFIGLEISWRYRHAPPTVDVHGAYNLAFRRTLLEEAGGFNETYLGPSGEDWDLTYRISRRHTIRFLPEAVVLHSHPERLGPYLALQVRRGCDRIKLYGDHPDKMTKDAYTGPVVKFEVVAAALLPAAWLAGVAGRPLFWSFLIFLMVAAALPIPYIFRQAGAGTALFSFGVRMIRYYAWVAGAVWGVFKYGLPFCGRGKRRTCGSNS